MDSFHVPGGRRTPEITFDPGTHVHTVSGESFPEDTATFYEPVFAWLETYLSAAPQDREVVFNLEIPYFNSSSAKILMDFFSLLEEAADKGATIVVNWLYEADDEANMEYGEEFAEDINGIVFNLVEKAE